MRPFTPTPAGLASNLERHEAHLLAQAADEVCALLDAPVLDPMLMGALTDDTPPRPDPADLPLTNLLQPMASDPALDDELRSLSAESLRQDKAHRLACLADALRSAASSDGMVLVRPGEEWTWLGALTDMRLALAGTLGAGSAADVEAIERYAHRVARATDPGDLAAADAINPLVATVFTLLGAWQESLLAAMETTEVRH